MRSSKGYCYQGDRSFLKVPREDTLAVSGDYAVGRMEKELCSVDKNIGSRRRPGDTFAECVEASSVFG